MSTGPGRGCDRHRQHDRARHPQPTARTAVLTRRPRPRPPSMIVLDGTIVGVALPGSSPTCTSTWPTPTGQRDLRDDLRRAAPHRRADRRSLGTPPDLRRRVVLRHPSILAARADSATALIASRALQSRRRARPSVHPVDGQRDLPRRDRATAFGIWGAVMAGMAAVGPLLGGWLTRVSTGAGSSTSTSPSGAGPARHHPLRLRRAEHRAAGVSTSTASPAESVCRSSSSDSSRARPRVVPAGRRPPRRQLDVADVSSPSHRPRRPLLVGAIFVGLFVVWERHRHAPPRRHPRSQPLLRAHLHVGQPHGRRRRRGRVRAGLRAAALPRQRSRPGHRGRRLGPGRDGDRRLRQWRAGASSRGSTVPDQGRPPRPGPRGRRRRRTRAAPLSSTMPAWAVAVPLVVYGVGLGLASAQGLTSTVLADVPPAQSGSGSATQSTARQVGSALGTAPRRLDPRPPSGTPSPPAWPTSPAFPPPSRPNLTDATAASAGGSSRRSGPRDDRTVRRPRPADRGRAGRGLRRRDSDRPGRRPAMLLLGLAGAVVVDRVRLS